MKSKLLSCALFTLSLIIPQALHAIEKINIFNDTDHAFIAEILSGDHAKQYLLIRNTQTEMPINLSLLRVIIPHAKQDLYEQLDGAPYVLTIATTEHRGSRNLIIKPFTIQNIENLSEIHVTASPAGSKNFQVWYRSGQATRSKRALAVMEATHKRIGAGVLDLGGADTYKQIAKYLLIEPWQPATPLH